MAKAERILIVDDNAKNRDVLQDMMLALGYTPILAENGVVALEQIHKQPPDLVLLDILMPGMDGYEVLKRLKSEDALLAIAVIMISAVDELDSVVRCIEQGADDYLVKPFNPTLLKARVEACLDKKRLRDQEKVYQKLIEGYNLELEEQVRQKSWELAEAHKKLQLLDKTKNDLLHLIAHELRTPLRGVLVAGEVLSKENLVESAREKFRRDFKHYRDRLLAVLDDALLLTHIEVSHEKFPFEPISIRSVLEAVVELTSGFAESRQVHIEQIPGSDQLVLGEKKMLTKALVALLKAAVKFSEQEQMVSLSCDAVEDEVSLRIRATGRTVPEKTIPKFFEVSSFAKAITADEELGLGPAVAERIITFFDGSVVVENHDPPGISFIVTLKLAKVGSQGSFRVFAH